MEPSNKARVNRRAPLGFYKRLNILKKEVRACKIVWCLDVTNTVGIFCKFHWRMLDKETRLTISDLFMNDNTDCDEFRNLVKESIMKVKMKDVLLPPMSGTSDKYRR